MAMTPEAAEALYQSRMDEWAEITKELDICDKMWSKRNFKDDDRRIIRAGDKHQDSYYSAKTREEILQAALCIVWNRMYYYPNKRHEIPPRPFKKDEEIPESLQKEAYKQVNDWIRRKKWMMEDNEIFDLLRVVKSDHPEYAGLAAFRIIELRDCHQYEEWWFEHLGDTEKWIASAKETIKKRQQRKKAA